MCYKNLFMEQANPKASCQQQSSIPGTGVGLDDNGVPFFYEETDYFNDFPTTIPSASLTHLEEQNTSPMSFASEYSPPGASARGMYHTAGVPQMPAYPCYTSSSSSTISPRLLNGVHVKERHYTPRPVYNGFTSPPEYAPPYNGATGHANNGVTTHLPSFLQILQGLDCQDQFSPDGELKFAVPPATSPLSMASGQSSLCKVCGDVASGNHFGVLSCEACKSFFRRSVRAGARYACRGTRGCSVEKHTRNRCQYCRLQKCIQMGMRKEAVQEERAPPVTKLHAAPQRAETPTQLGYTSSATGTNLYGIGPNSSPAMPQLPIPQLPSYHRTYDSPVSPVVPSNLMSHSRMFGSLPNLKMGLDLEQQPLTPPMHIPPLDPYMSNPMTPSGGVSSTYSNTNMYQPSMSSTATSGGGGSQISASVLVNADSQVDVPPENVTTADKGVKLEEIFEGARQSLLRVIEWGKRIPAFTTLSLDDQVKLLKSCWCEHVLLKLSTRIGPRSETLLLSSGITCRKDQIEDPEVRRIVERVSHEISYWFDVLHVDRVEMACLKGIILFNPDARGLSPGVRKKVEIFQEQILSALETRCKTMYPVTPLRFSKLLLRLPPLRAAALEATQHMEVQRTLGNAKMDNIFGELLDFD